MTEYCAADEIASFFTKTSATRSLCDARARALTGHDATPVAIQGNCSYTVYAGQNSVIQFRLRSLKLHQHTTQLASQVYGDLAPHVTYEGQLGDDRDKDGKEPLLVYHMGRIPGISHLDFILSTENNTAYRATLMADLGGFLARSWNNPQPITPDYRSLHSSYARDLSILRSALPPRFNDVIASCIASLDLIFGDDSDNNDDRSKSKGLPPVLVHRDLGTANIMVDPATCHLTGVVDWAESRIAPFGTNLHSLQAICGHMHLRHGWSRYDDYHALQGAFWSGLQGGIVAAGEERLDDATIEAIKMARKIGLLLSHGFTSRLANQPEPTPIDENTDHGRYHMHYLDGFLINEATRFD